VDIATTFAADALAYDASRGNTPVPVNVVQLLNMVGVRRLTICADGKCWRGKIPFSQAMELIRTAPVNVSHLSIESAVSPTQLLQLIETLAFPGCRGIASLQFSKCFGPLRSEPIAGDRLSRSWAPIHWSTGHRIDAVALPRLRVLVARGPGAAALAKQAAPTLRCLNVSHCDDIAVDLSSAGHLKRVGDGCFRLCGRLQALHLPPSVTSIGSRFISYCHALRSLDLSGTKLHTIGNDFAAQCYSLVSISFPSTLAHIGKYALCQCGVLAVIDLSHTQVRALEHSVSRLSRLNDLQLPPTLTRLDCSISSCDWLGVVDLLGCATLQVIHSCFCGCENLTAIRFPTGLREIGDYVLSCCNSMRMVDLSHTDVHTVGRLFCNSSPSVATVLMPTTLRRIGSDAFSYCAALQSVDLSRTWVHDAHDMGAGVPGFVVLFSLRT
jgi:hypothetical protein